MTKPVSTTWKHRSQPSQSYLRMTRQAYDRCTKPATCSDMWNQIIKMCWQTPGGFRAVFAWDSRKSVNRVRDLAEIIGVGLVPSLALSCDSKGREIVVSTIKEVTP